MSGSAQRLEQPRRPSGLVAVSNRAGPTIFTLGLDLPGECSIISGIVNCPICNVKVPFSLQMHLHMAHGPGARPDDGTILSLRHEPKTRAKEKRRVPRAG